MSAYTHVNLLPKIVTDHVIEGTPTRVEFLRLDPYIYLSKDGVVSLVIDMTYS